LPQRADGDAVEVAAQGGPGVVTAGLDEAAQEQREPAQDDVGADTFLFAVVDRS
jgi:hypothetical protein